MTIIGLQGTVDWLDTLTITDTDEVQAQLISKIRLYDLPLAVFYQDSQWIVALDERHVGRTLESSFWLNSFAEIGQTYEWMRYSIHPTFSNWTLVGKGMLNLI